MLSLLDPRMWAVGIAALALAFGAGYLRGSSSVKVEWRAATLAAEESKAQEESRRVVTLERIAHEARQEADARAAHAAAARAESRRLRSQLANIAARAAPTCRSEAGGDPVGVLADVLGRADERAAALAAIADDARARGLACERAYDAVRGRAVLGQGRG